MDENVSLNTSAFHIGTICIFAYFIFAIAIMALRIVAVSVSFGITATENF